MKYKVIARTTQTFEIEIEADSKKDAFNLASDIEPNDIRWKENRFLGGGWDIDYPPTIVK